MQECFFNLRAHLNEEVLEATRLSRNADTHTNTQTYVQKHTHTAELWTNLQSHQGPHKACGRHFHTLAVNFITKSPFAVKNPSLGLRFFAGKRVPFFRGKNLRERRDHQTPLQGVHLSHSCQARDSSRFRQAVLLVKLVHLALGEPHSPWCVSVSLFSSLTVWSCSKSWPPLHPSHSTSHFSLTGRSDRQRKHQGCNNKAGRSPTRDGKGVHTYTRARTQA